MKLYNQTRVPSIVLYSLLVKAGRSVGAATGGVVVRVGQGWSFACRGEEAGEH